MSTNVMSRRPATVADRAGRGAAGGAGPGFLRRAAGPVLAAALLAAVPAHAVEFSVLHHFDGKRGATPVGGLAIDSAGNVYGTASEGGKFSAGTLFKLSSAGFTTLHQFRGGSDGATPYGSLTVDAGGTLYGTTSAGGLPGAGTVFTLDSTGRYRVLLALDGGAQGRDIRAGVFKDADGALYGAAMSGGDPVADFGTIFRIDPVTTTLTTIHTFLGDDGAWPMATLILANGQLRGTGFGGTLFSVGLDGSNYARIGQALTVNGEFVAGQTADASGNFWGAAMTGTAADEGDLYRIDPTGSASWVYGFSDESNHTGRNPTGTLLLGTNGLLYGTTRLGGAGSCRCGTVFSYDPATGVRTTLHEFTGADGREPWAGVVQDATGMLYGVAISGGKHGLGTVFRIQP
jgi:uncharacterized repeat protein (TIGR03803 family)